jgi:hypothetical protein
MTSTDGPDRPSAVEKAHRDRHAELGTTIEVYLPPECPHEQMEQFYDGVSSLAFGIARSGWDPSVSAHRDPLEITRAPETADTVAPTRSALDTKDHLIAVAQTEAERHRPDDKRGGCTCGFCVWSAEHVLVMSMRAALEG